MAVSQSWFYHISLVFHVSLKYFTSYSEFRGTVLLTNIRYAWIWLLVSSKWFLLIHELLNCNNYMESKCILLTLLRWICVKLCQPISVDILLTSLTPLRHERFDIWTVNQTWQSKKWCVWILGAPTAWLYTPLDYVMNTDTSLLGFPKFLGLPQLKQGRNGCRLWQKEMKRPSSFWLY